MARENTDNLRAMILHSTSVAASGVGSVWANSPRITDSASGLTDGKNIRIGPHAVPGTGVGTTFIQGGATNYENVIGGDLTTVNTATSNINATVAGDGANRSWSAIIHGYDNVNNGWADVVTGFHHKVGTGANHGTIAGGSLSEIAAGKAYCTISGGTGHTALADSGTVGGGETNSVGGDGGTHATVSGGLSNQARGLGSTVSGGMSNTAAGAAATVAGGQTNSANGAHASVIGGNSNTATGNRATVVGGTGNTASTGDAYVFGGARSTASAANAASFGATDSTASGTYSVVLGGYLNEASASYGSAQGRSASSSLYGVNARAAGQFAAKGDAQVLSIVMRGISTDATPKDLFLDGGGARLNPQTPLTWGVTGQIVGRRTDTVGEFAVYNVSFAVHRSTSGTPTVAGVSITPVFESVAAWNVAITGDAATNSIKVACTGEAAKTIRWVAGLTATCVAS